MNAKTWQQAKEWLLEAAALPEAARAPFLSSRCPDAALRRELLEMLASDGTLSGIVDRAALTGGTRLGRYEIDTVIGVGGMGEVYRACDSRLGRDVAIKVLPAAFATDHDRLARFEREAKLLASLNHPHICTLFDVGREAGIDFIVMECVEGELLSDRLRQGPLPIDTALGYAIEIADALDKAHVHGIIHRDLKPGNVMLTKSGTKLLDFGLARSTHTPSHEVTRTGMILGTLRYMAPEQLKGADADTRSDVWAFGCVLYQMLAGRSPFEGESEAAIGAAILEAQPSPISLSAPGAPSLQRVVDRCLAKSPDDRWQSVADLRHELEWIATPSRAVDTPRTRESGMRWGERIAWIAVVALAAVAIAALVAERRRAPDVPAAMQFTLDSPKIMGAPMFPTLSPDGRQLAYVGLAEGASGSVIWVRSMDTGVARSLAGTSVDRPFLFWKPDGHSIGFFADGKLKRVDLGTGLIRVVCRVDSSRGAAWAPDGTIVFARSSGPLMRVSGEGGDPAPLTQTTGGRESHRFPSMLADGRHFVFTLWEYNGWSSIRLGSLDSSSTTELLRTSTSADSPDDLSQGVIDGDWLLTVRRQSLTARHLDGSHTHVVGDEVVMAKDIDLDSNGRMAFTAAGGVLAYRTATPAMQQLAWASRSGQIEGTLWSPGAIDTVSLSPDGNRALVALGWLSSPRALWVVDVRRNVGSQLSTEAVMWPLWSPDGAQILFLKPLGRSFTDIYALRADGSGSDALVVSKPEGTKRPIGWTDKGTLIVQITEQSGATALWEVPQSAGAAASKTSSQWEFTPTAIAVSADAQLAAYIARNELYLRAIRGGSGVLVSSGDVHEVRWRGDGHELYYLAGGHLMAVDVSGTDPVVAGTPHALFDFAGPTFAVAADGARFLLATPFGPQHETQLNAVVNWQSRLAR